MSVCIMCIEKVCIEKVPIFQYILNGKIYFWHGNSHVKLHHENNKLFKLKNVFEKIDLKGYAFDTTLPKFWEELINTPRKYHISTSYTMIYCNNNVVNHFYIEIFSLTKP